MKALDLFSCIGCHAIGFERAGIDTIAFCERNPWRRARLAERFPGKPIYDDIRDFRDELPAEIIIGGPPCQNTSVAAAVHGGRTGESLWPDMLRICDALRPEWVVVEQPPGNAVWETEVAHDLSEIGYYTAKAQFAACDVGAPFLRERVFILASPGLPRLEGAWRSIPSEIERVKRAAHARGDWDADQLASLQVDARSAGEGGDDYREHIEALGDSNPPHMAEVVGRAILAHTSR